MWHTLIELFGWLLIDCTSPSLRVVITFNQLRVFVVLGLNHWLISSCCSSVSSSTLINLSQRVVVGFTFLIWFKGQILGQFNFVFGYRLLEFELNFKGARFSRNYWGLILNSWIEKAIFGKFRNQFSVRVLRRKDHQALFVWIKENAHNYVTLQQRIVYHSTKHFLIRKSLVHNTNHHTSAMVHHLRLWNGWVGHWALHNWGSCFRILYL